MARPRSPNSTSDRQRIQFAFNADRDTPIGKVFKYLLKSDKLPSRKGKHKGLDAISAFWKPFAYQADEQLSDEEKKAIARESVEALTRQIDLIRQTFDLEKPQASGEFKEDIKAVFTEVVQELIGANAGGVSSASQVTTPLASAAKITPASNPNAKTEGIDFDEAALLGGLFEDSDIAA